MAGEDLLCGLVSVQLRQPGHLVFILLLSVAWELLQLSKLRRTVCDFL